MGGHCQDGRLPFLGQYKQRLRCKVGAREFARNANESPSVWPIDWWTFFLSSLLNGWLTPPGVCPLFPCCQHANDLERNLTLLFGAGMRGARRGLPSFKGDVMRAAHTERKWKELNNRLQQQERPIISGGGWKPGQGHSLGFGRAFCFRCCFSFAFAFRAPPTPLFTQRERVRERRAPSGDSSSDFLFRPWGVPICVHTATKSITEKLPRAPN